MSVWDDVGFMARRKAARKRLDGLRGAESGGWADRRTWFEQVYETAAGDAAQIPWADLAPKPALLRWLADNSAPPGRPVTAVDVACGLGDNAEALAAVGYAVTAFDLAEKAIDWAKRRFEGSSVRYVVADLFDAPLEWRHGFDLVHESYTLQALTEPLRGRAMRRIADLVAPGGRLLVITRGREDGAEANGPPWPLSPAELARFAGHGLEQLSLADLIEQRDRPVRHFLAEYRRT